MGVFLLRMEPKIFMGPHSTCLQTSESYKQKHTVSRSRGTWNEQQLQHFLYTHIRFMFILGAGLVCLLMFVITGLLFVFSYFGTRLFLRFQFKLTVLFIMLRQDRFHFEKLNNFIIYFLHVNMMLIGGFAYIFMFFIDLWKLAHFHHVFYFVIFFIDNFVFM